mmetsp:Transcript_141469/g.257108  ORF Transcript_141469/g.257108 Transcript_141469/m.257108 type:complete len:94 (-) Transcript_141469:1540-1821(-)
MPLRNRSLLMKIPPAEKPSTQLTTVRCLQSFASEFGQAGHANPAACWYASECGNVRRHSRMACVPCAASPQLCYECQEPIISTSQSALKPSYS